MNAALLDSGMYTAHVNEEMGDFMTPKLANDWISEVG